MVNVIYIPGFRYQLWLMSCIFLISDTKYGHYIVNAIASSIPAQFHTFVEIDHEIISTVILLPSAESIKKGCCQLQRKYVHEVLVNCLFKLAQENVWLDELTVPQ